MTLRLNDLVTGTVVTIDEWVKNEIYRLQNNIKPRHFQSYSDLADMLQDEPCRFQYQLPTPVWLCQLFIKLMRYTNKMVAPRLLLTEFEQLRLDVNLGKGVNLKEFRERLSSILFGQIQLTEDLVNTWKIMCEWVTQPSLHNHQLALRWLDLSLSAYLIATYYRILIQ